LASVFFFLKGFALGENRKAQGTAKESTLVKLTAANDISSANRLVPATTVP